MADCISFCELEIKDISGSIEFSFLCPRCQQYSRIRIPAESLVYGAGAVLWCGTGLCAIGTLSVDLRIEGEGYVKSLLDVPLNDLSKYNGGQQ